jgi:hypothetical protein
VGMKVLMAHDGDDLACKCWSASDMSRHESAEPPKGIFYPSFTGTLTCVKSLAMMFERIVPPYPNVLQ